MIIKNNLSVVIVNYKTPKLAIDCIHSLHNQLNSKYDKIIIVDNNSGNNDINFIRNTIEHDGLSDLITLISSPVNNGFSAGNNIGIKSVNSHFYLLTNADTLFLPDVISSLLSAAEKYPEAGIISPRLEWSDGVPQISCFRFHTPLSELICSAGTGVITRLLNNYDVPLQVLNDVTMPDWTSFACVLIRRDVFEKIGFLDEGYFMYYEDVDFCRRAKKAGFEVVNWPFAHVVHLRGQSSGIKKLHQKKMRLPPYHYQSRARYYTKFYGQLGFLMCNLCWLAGRSISLLREILFGKSRTVSEYQYLDIWKK
jgi:GT2 family glycosyltransferase